MGLSGAGKSEVAQFINRKYGWPIISRDRIRAAMFEPCLYTEREKLAAFCALKEAVAAAVEENRSCVVNGMSFSRVGEYEEVKEVVQQKAGVTIPIFCDVPLDVAVARVKRDRLSSKHIAKVRDESMVKEMYERFREIPEGAVRLDTSRTQENVLEDIVGIIDEIRGN